MTQEIKERMDPETFSPMSYAAHVGLYKFASEYCASKEVLDMACGIGYGSVILSQASSSVVGAELSLGALRENRDEGSPNLQFVCVDASRPPFAFRSFDVIVSIETIEHLPDYRSFLTACSSLLRPDGVLVISTPNTVFSEPTKLLMNKDARPANPFHVREFRTGEFASLLRSYFGDVTLFSQSYMPFRARAAMAAMELSHLVLPKGLRRRISNSAHDAIGKGMGLDENLALEGGSVIPFKKNCATLVAVCRQPTMAKGSEVVI